MKRKLLLLLAIVVATRLIAQVPQKMSYQAVLRNSSNTLITQTVVGMRISILQGSEVGTPVYVETQAPTTNINGLASLEIGTGGAVTGTFAAIDWSAGPYFIKTETDPAGGSNYSITGTSQLLSVPYALFSANGTPGPAGSPGPSGETGPNGLSAYQVWLSLGNTGTAADFIASLTGPQGPQGSQGPQGGQGPQGEHAPCNGAPAAPAIIYGSVCKGARSTLSIDPVPGATSYVWGCSSGGCSASGTYFSQPIGGNSAATYVFVKAVNDCGSSGETRIYFNQTHGIAKFTPTATGTKASTFVVPCNVTSLNIEIAGAGGGAGFAETLQAPGGLGAYMKGTLVVTPGQVLVFNAGNKGGNATYNGGGVGGKGGNINRRVTGIIYGDNNGGDGAGDGTTVFIAPACSSTGNGTGGGGGAGSDIRAPAPTQNINFNTVHEDAQFQEILVAVGGGGGGGASFNGGVNLNGIDGNAGGDGGFLDVVDQPPSSGIENTTRDARNASTKFQGSSSGSTINANGINGELGTSAGRNCNDNGNKAAVPAGSGGGGGGGGGAGRKGGGGGGGTGTYTTSFTPETRTGGANAGDGYIIVRW